MASTGPDPSDTLDISLLSISSDKSAIWGPKVPASIFNEINFNEISFYVINFDEINFDATNFDKIHWDEIHVEEILFDEIIFF